MKFRVEFQLMHDVVNIYPERCCSLTFVLLESSLFYIAFKSSKDV